MGPFGDFIDEKAWLAYRQKLNVSLYVREFENRDHWFPAAGGGLNQFRLAPRLRVSAFVHYWKQPLDLSFNSGTSKPGGAVDVSASYQLTRQSTRHVSLDVGLIAKTVGFLPEETSLDRHVGFRFGLSVMR